MGTIPLGAWEKAPGSDAYTATTGANPLITQTSDLSSSEAARQSIMETAMLEEVMMQDRAQRFRQSVAQQRINMSRQASLDARRMAATSLGELATSPGTAVVGDAILGWTENYLTQLTPTAVATGAPALAASQFNEMKSALTLGVVKDLADLMK
jgi:hypothetical protein